MTNTQQPLDGVLVLDLTQIYNGPYATFLMAEAGAEVVKVEPPGGEFLRRRDARSGAGVPFAMLNGNKRSVSLNLKSNEGRAMFLDLVKDADVVAENYAPGVMERLGLDYETLRAINPKIIFASGSGYGQSGDYRDYQAMDLTIQAMSGVMSTTGFPENAPVKSGAALCDFFGGVHMFGAIMMALYRRGVTGAGSYIDISMLETVYPSLASTIGMLHGERDDIPPRTGNRHGGLSLCPYNVYPTNDGHLAIICNNDKHWHALLTAMDRTDLIEGPRYASMRDRVAVMDEIDSMVGEWTATWTRNALFDHLSDSRVPCAPVRHLDEVVHDPVLRDRGALLDIDHPQYGEVVVCRSPLRFDGIDRPDYHPSPDYGVDNEDFYSRKLDLSGTEIAALKERGVI
jgi:CoA:oxalate CoA-transferase